MTLPVLLMYFKCCKCCFFHAKLKILSTCGILKCTQNSVFKIAVNLRNSMKVIFRGEKHFILSSLHLFLLHFVFHLQPGEFTSDPYNNCTIYSCTDLKNQLISSTSEITCPAFSEESCKPVSTYGKRTLNAYIASVEFIHLIKQCLN